MNPMPLVVRWIVVSAARLRAVLAAALEIDVPAGRPIAIGGLRLEIVEGEPASPTVDRLEIGDDPVLGTVHAIDASTGVGTRLLALGWATVDMDRAAATWANARWSPARRDSLVGSRVLLGGPALGVAPAATSTDAGRAASVAGGAPSSTGVGATGREPAADAPPGATSVTITVALLEPDTEGRLAAALARHAEGPAALYVGVPAATFTQARARLMRAGQRVSTGSGPFGHEMAVMAPPAWSPTLILVPVSGSGLDARRIPASPVRGGGGTIGP